MEASVLQVTIVIAAPQTRSHVKTLPLDWKCLVLVQMIVVLVLLVTYVTTEIRFLNLVNLVTIVLWERVALRVHGDDTINSIRDHLLTTA